MKGSKNYIGRIDDKNELLLFCCQKYKPLSDLPIIPGNKIFLCHINITQKKMSWKT